MKPSSSSVGVCTLLVAVASLQLLLVVAVAASAKTAPAMPDEEFLGRLCDQQQGATRRRLPWCQQLHARRRHGGGGGGVGVGKRRRVPMRRPAAPARRSTRATTCPSGSCRADRTRCTTRLIDRSCICRLHCMRACVLIDLSSRCAGAADRRLGARPRSVRPYSTTVLLLY